MAKGSFGDALKKSFLNTVDNVKEATKDIKMPEVKVPDLKDIKMPEIKIPDQIKNIGKQENDIHVLSAEECRGISVENAIKIIYCMMSVDGVVKDEEIDEFVLIGKGFAENFDDVKDTVIEECEKRIKIENGVRDYFDAICYIVDDLMRPESQGQSPINNRLFVWDLLTIAYADKEYDEKEKKLLNYIAAKLDVDQAVFREMESSMLTVMDIEKEIAWIKTTDRPYLKIEAVVNELTDRKNTIMGSLMELIIM